jgi:hypothetical protein
MKYGVEINPGVTKCCKDLFSYSKGDREDTQAHGMMISWDEFYFSK